MSRFGIAARFVGAVVNTFGIFEFNARTRFTDNLFFFGTAPAVAAVGFFLVVSVAPAVAVAPLAGDGAGGLYLVPHITQLSLLELLTTLQEEQVQSVLGAGPSIAIE